MFTNKEEFKQEFSERFSHTYGRSVASSDPTERFLTLGEMIRDYASMNWMDTKDEIAKHLPGERVTVTILRDGETEDLRLTLGNTLSR